MGGQCGQGAVFVGYVVDESVWDTQVVFKTVWGAVNEECVTEV